MKVLLTSVRLPHALGQIRKLAEAGHEVYATDTLAELCTSAIHEKAKIFVNIVWQSDIIHL